MNVKQLVLSVIETIIKVVVAVFIIMYIYRTAIEAYDYGYRVFAEEPMSLGEGRTISISVEQDDSAYDIGQNLKKKGLIRDAKLFYVQELLSEYHGKEIPGIYDLSTSMTSSEMMAIMAGEVEETDEEVVPELNEDAIMSEEAQDAFLTDEGLMDSDAEGEQPTEGSEE